MLARNRWFFLLGALGATVIAIFYPVEQELELQQPVEVQSSKHQPKEKTSQFVYVNNENDSQEIDPFSPRGWGAQPAAVVANQVVKTVVAEPAPALQAPLGPPPLPYRFLGKLTDEGDIIVYLGRGEQTHVAKVGEVIESTYKVLKITEQNLELEHLPTGEKQSLSIE